MANCDFYNFLIDFFIKLKILFYWEIINCKNQGFPVFGIKGIYIEIETKTLPLTYQMSIPNLTKLEYE